MKNCIFLLVLVLTGCVRSSILPIGDDTYLLMRSEKGTDAESVKEAAVEEAKKHCASKGMSTEIMGASEKEMVLFTSDPESEVTFKCLSEE